MKLKSKLLTAVILTLCAVVAAQVFLLHQYSTMSRVEKEGIKEYELEKLQINTIKHQLKLQLVNWRNMLTQGADQNVYHAYLQEFYNNERKIFKEFDNLKGIVSDYQKFEIKLMAISQKLHDNRTAFRQALQVFLDTTINRHEIAETLSDHLTVTNNLLVELESQLLAFHLSKIRAQNEKLESNIISMIIVTLAISFIGIVLFRFALHHFILNPLKGAVNVALSIANGESSQRLSSTYKDEIGHFAEAFNEMIDKVEENRSALETANMQISQHTEQLEGEVASRTMQLAAANSELHIGSVVFENSLDAIAITDENYQIIRINKAFERVMQYGIEDLTYKSITTLFAEGWKEQKFEAIKRDIHNIGRWRGEFQQQKKNHDTLITWLNVNQVQVKGETYHIFNFSDITERKRAEQKIWKQANFDYVTELPNRSMFMQYVQEVVFNHADEDFHCALLFIDIEGFKRVNDSFGHPAGDELLKIMGQGLAEITNETDMLARMGGDEFVLFANQVSTATQGLTIAEQIIKKLSEPYRIRDSHQIYMGGNVGVALYPDHANSLDELINCADTAMYSAKRAGINGYALFEQAMNDDAKHRLAIDNDLRNAKEEDFHLYLQPIVNCKGELLSCEGLVRWIHPEKGMVPPDAFISIAEDTGFITTLGKWVTLKAKRILKRWETQGRGNITMSINLSPKQLISGEYTEFLRDELQNESIRSQLIIEITENVMMQQNDSSFEFIDAATAMGIHISLDDFGTGYSSLSYLKRYKANYIKIDRSFVNDITTNSADRVICEAIIAIGQAYGMKVIAEGVEDEEQLNLLDKLSCNAYQGYYFSRPLPVDEFEGKMFKS